MVCYPQFVVTVSNTLVFFSKQVNSYFRHTLVSLKSWLESVILTFLDFEFINLFIFRRLILCRTIGNS